AGVFGRLAGDPEDALAAELGQPIHRGQPAAERHQVGPLLRSVVVSTGTVAAPTATAPPKRRARITERARGERRLAYMLIAPSVIVMLLVTGYPIIDAFVLSLQRADLRFPNATKFIGF